MEYFRQNIIPAEVFVQLLAFLIVLGVLKFFAWKPILKLLEDRREKIKKGFEEIACLKKEAEVLKSDYAGHLQRIEEEARAKIQEAVEEGRKISREIQQKAREESQETLARAKENLDIEVAKARVTLRRDVADLSLRVAEKILQEKMSESKQQEKVLEIIKELEKS